MFVCYPLDSEITYRVSFVQRTVQLVCVARLAFNGTSLASAHAVRLCKVITDELAYCYSNVVVRCRHAWRLETHVATKRIERKKSIALRGFRAVCGIDVPPTVSLVGWLVGRSVGWSVGRSVVWLVGYWFWPAGQPGERRKCCR